MDVTAPLLGILTKQRQALETLLLRLGEGDDVREAVVLVRDCDLMRAAFVAGIAADLDLPADGLTLGRLARHQRQPCKSLLLSQRRELRALRDDVQSAAMATGRTVSLPALDDFLDGRRGHLELC